MDVTFCYTSLCIFAVIAVKYVNIVYTKTGGRN